MVTSVQERVLRNNRVIDWLHEHYDNQGVKTASGDVLVFKRKNGGRWLSEGDEHWYWVVRNGDLWSLVVIDKDSGSVDQDDMPRRQYAQGVAEAYETLAAEYRTDRTVDGLVRIALAHRTVMQRIAPDDEQRWGRNVPRALDVAGLARAL